MMTLETSRWRRMRHTRFLDLIRGRLNGNLDWKQIIANAQLPDDVGQLTYRVVKSTRLSRYEKADVARELIAHFEDGVQAGKSTSEMITTFGDPIQAATLMRRAKKRNRSLLWHAGKYLCWCLLGIFAIYGVFYLRFAIGTPSITTDYLEQVNQRVAVGPKEELAWPLYREALENFRRANTDIFWNSSVAMTNEEWQAQVTLAEQHQQSLELIRQAITT